MTTAKDMSSMNQDNRTTSKEPHQEEIGFVTPPVSIGEDTVEDNQSISQKQEQRTSRDDR